MIRKIFSFDFDESIKDKDRLDGILAIIIFIYSLAVIYLYGKIVMEWPTYDELLMKFENPNLGQLITNIPIAIIQVLPIFIILLVRRQKMSSIGFKLKGSLIQFLLGILFVIPIAIKPYLKFKEFYRPLNLEFTLDKLYLLLYFIIAVAFVEEVVFRGFIQTRLQGLIKNRLVVCFIVALMFSSMHIPFQMLISSMSFMDYIASARENLIFTFIMHFYYSYIYTRDNNIIAPITTHALYDFFCIALYM